MQHSQNVSQAHTEHNQKNMRAKVSARYVLNTAKSLLNNV